MAETVGQHSVAAFTSPVNGTTPIDANSVRGNDNTMRSAYVDHDADPGIHVQSSTLASRPVAGTAGRKWVTVSSGRYQFWYDDGTRWHEIASDAINVDCLADANLAKGDVVKITGFNNGQNLPTVNKVTASTDVAFGVVENTVTSGNLVQIVNTGLIEDVDTNGYAVGTILYPNTSGGWTTTKPTSGNYQPAGFVLRGNTNNGVLYVEFSAPRIVERSNNEASTIVLRDASGNFAAGTITAGALTSTGLVTFASLKGTGATTVTNILDEDNMASDSATALATQQSIKAYVDTKVATVDTLAEVLANGNTTGATDIIVTAGQKITTDTIAETTAAAGVTIDSVLLKDNAVTATTFNGTLNGAAPAGSLSGTTLASNVVSSSLTSVGTLANLTVTNPITGSVTGSSGSTTGNAATATALQTARNINGVSFNGTADITVTAAAGTLTGTTLASGVTASSLTSVGTLSSLTVSGTSTLNNTVTITGPNVGNPPLIVRNANSVNSGEILLGGTTYGAKITRDSIGADQDLLIVNSHGGAQGFKFRTGSTTAGTTDLMVLTGSGNLGIGTASPANDLDVSRSAAAGSVIASVVNTSSTGAARIYLGNDGNASAGRVQIFGSSHAVRPNIMTIGTDSSLPLVFDTGGTERARIDTSGNLGLGVTPSAWASSWKAMQIGFTSRSLASTGAGAGDLTLAFNAVFDATDSRWEYAATGDKAGRYSQTGSGDHIWYVTNTTGTAGNAITFTQAMTLDASGNLGVGTGSTALTGKLEIKTSTTISAPFTGTQIKLLGDGGNNSNYSGIAYRVSTTDNYGWTAGAIRNADVDVGAFIFKWHNNSAAGTEYARITSGGYFKASPNGTYNNATGTYHEVVSTSDNTGTLIVKHTGTSGAQYGITITTVNDQNDATRYFWSGEGAGVERGTLRSNGGLANYSANNVNLASDFRLKQDIAPLASTWDKLKAIEVVNFRYKDCNEDDPALYGVIAQQVQPIVPELVVVTREAVEAKDAELDEDGNEVKPAVEAAPEYYGIREQPMYWLAIKALQEAQARIEALEARLEALEA